MPEPEFHFDIGSPNAYLAHRVLPGIEARTGARFAYVPILLGGVFKLTGNRSPAEAFAGIRNKNEYARMETARFLARHGITNYVRNPHFPVNTLAAMRVIVAARGLGVFAPCVAALFAALWEDQRKLDDPAILEATLREAGLDAAALLAGAQGAAVKAELIANTEASVARGTFGAPSFYVGEDLWFGKDSLRDVEEAILRR
ncbi:MAG: 2-hydroxychromene-2-carboxylate isomerase [Rhodospirillales bacterium]|nr:2-hydroxychromene-2-carboxylate isomerase [Rhodospirillales bacterium]